jgi:Zn-dependent protease with chaperone function
MGGLIALLGIGGRALGGTQGMLLFGGCPENLAAALAQQVEQGQQVRPYEFPGPATAHLFIVPPVRGAAPPPTEERIRLLQAMRA